MAVSEPPFKNSSREGQPASSKDFICSGFWGFVRLTRPFLFHLDGEALTFGRADVTLSEII